MGEQRQRQFLENETRLRQVRLLNLQVASSTGGKTGGAASKQPDGTRDHWKRGTKISVFSQSDQTWFNGVVVAIQEDGGLFEKLEVHYKKNGQRHKKFIPRYSQYLNAR